MSADRAPPDRTQSDRAQMPRIEETAAHLPDSLYRMIGGGWAVAGFCLVATAVVAWDFGMGLVIDFPIRCVQNTWHHAGGFALALAALLALLVVGLSVAAPRSLFIGWVILFVTAAFLQYSVAGYNDFENFIRAKWWLRGALTLPVCDTPYAGQVNILVLQDFLLGRYFTEGSYLGTPFTTGLAVNLAVLAVAVGLVWLIAAGQGIRALFARWRGRRPGPWREDIHLWLFSMNRTERALIVLAGAFTVLVTMIAPAALVGLSSTPMVYGEQVQNLLWIGPLVFLVDLARLAWYEPDPQPLARDADAPGDVPVPLVLADLVRSLRQVFPQRAATDAVIGRKPDTSAAGTAALPQSGTIEYHESGLVAGHLDRFTDIANRRVLNEGRSALVISPVEVQPQVMDEMDRRFRDDPGDGVVRCWAEGGQNNADDIDVMFLPPEALSQMLDRAGEFHTFLQRLGAIFVVGIHRLDLGLLHVAMKRLERQVADTEAMMAVIQGERRNGMSDWIKNLPLLRGKPVSGQVRIETGSAIDQHVVVAVGARDDSLDSDERGWPTDVQLMLHAMRNVDAAEPYCFDHNARHVPSQWARVVHHLQNGPDHRLAARRPVLRTTLVLPVAHPHPMAVIEDAGNLVDALGTEVTAPGALEALRVILRGSYPAAVFLHRRIDRALSAAGRDTMRNRIARLQEELGSLTPDPDGGLVELAMMVKQEILARGQKVRQQDLETIWPEAKPAFRHLQVANTRAGLERLLRIALQVDSRDTFVRTVQTNDRMLTYGLAADAIEKGTAFAALQVRVRNARARVDPADQTVRLEVLANADHGLSYMKGTRLVMRGRVIEVDEVDAQRREVHVKYREDSAPPHGYTFVREYAFLTATDNRHGFAAEALDYVRDRQVPFELASGFMQVARQTRGYYTHESTFRRHGEMAHPFSMSDGDAASPLHLRSVAVLRCLQGETGPAPRRPGPMAPRRGTPGAGQVSPEVAFTLATTLQDVLHTCFPVHAHRLAVLCPAAQKLGLRPDAGAVQRFAVDRLPSIRPLDPSTSRVGVRARAIAQPGQVGNEFGLIDDLAKAFFDRAREEVGAAAPGQAAILTFFILEDSDHDLGVARSIVGQHAAAILDRWYALVSDCCEEPETAAAYGFGAPGVPACFDFRGAEIILKGMKSAVV